MPCVHKFFGHENHLPGENGLLPNWEVDTLIIGTFNPSNDWTIGNLAQYFYGRSSYFWKVLPLFGCIDPIDNQNTQSQLTFLRNNKIGLTDLLISINDADIELPEHRTWINTYLDNDLMHFQNITWNTEQILRYVIDNGVKAVYFTKLGDAAPFGFQMQIIEEFCDLNRIPNFRLHSPTGQGLGAGRPRKHKLLHRWYTQGANQFPFLCPEFNINDPAFNWQ